MATHRLCIREIIEVQRKPDFLLILMAAFGVGVLITLLLPMSASNTVAAPVSELHAGVFAGD